jgi:hypothetical protein
MNLPRRGRQRLQIGTMAFANEFAAIEFFRTMLYRHRPYEMVRAHDAEHLSALLARHAKFTVKAGVGVSHFQVVKNAHGSLSFQVVRLDGTGEVFSYLHCIRNGHGVRE